MKHKISLEKAISLAKKVDSWELTEICYDIYTDCYGSMFEGTRDEKKYVGQLKDLTFVLDNLNYRGKYEYTLSIKVNNIDFDKYEEYYY